MSIFYETDRHDNANPLSVYQADTPYEKKINCCHTMDVIKDV